MSDILKLSLEEIHNGLIEKDFSSREVTELCFKSIEEKDGNINSFVTLSKDGAFAVADGVDAKIAKGEGIAMLEGVPMAFKDIFNTKGVATTCGSSMLSDFVPPYSATVVEKLDGNGAVMLGKTNMDEFACGSSTEHSVFGVTKNPHDLSRVAGGSSGGSAACVSADMAFYSLGTDTGGSIRQPASFCGVYGLKVTYGRVSRSGVTAMASSWDTVGPFTKTIKDMAFVLNAIVGHDRRDSTTPDVEVPDYTSFVGDGVKGLKVGLPKEYFSDGVSNEVKEVVLKASKKLESLGAVVKEVSLPMTKYAVAVYYLTQPAELSANLERFDGIRYGKKPISDVSSLEDYYFKVRGEGFGDEIKRRIMIGTYVLSAGYYDAYYKKAQRVRTLIIEDFKQVFEDVDVLLAPVAPSPAFKVGEFLDDPLSMYMADALAIPSSAAGLPALSCPFGTTKEGLPVGVQVIAPQFKEGRCIMVAGALEY